jgi:PAS domain-containing protein
MPDIVVSTLTRTDEEVFALRRENAKLRKINQALMASVERGPDLQGGAFALFQTAAALGNQVQERTFALTEALGALTGAKEEEAQAKKRLAAAIEAINQGIVLCDAQDLIVVTNRRYRELWGGLPAEPGTPFAAVVKGAATRGMVACGGDTEAWETFRLERHRNPGEPFVIEVSDGTWLQVSERRVAGGGTVSLYTDITEIKRDEAQRRERELEEKSVLLQATLDNLSQGVSVFDADRQLVACNPGFHDFLRDAACNASPCTAQELSACSVARLDSLNLRFVHSPDSNEGRSLEFKSPNNRIFDIRTSLMPGGTCVSTFTDVTERLRISDALKEANEGLERRVEARTADLIRANAEILAAKA